MKKTVIDIGDLQEISPFFKSKFGVFIGKRLIKWLCVGKVNRVHANSCHLSGSAFTSSLLKDPLVNLSYEVHNREILNTLPQGAFITVSNHPVGSLDGIILIDIFAAIRPDFRVMVNDILAHVGAMKNNFITVLPNSKNQGANLQNVNGIRASLEHLRAGHPMGFFPSGAMSFYQKKLNAVRDMSWAHSVIRIIQKAKVPVYPVYFDFFNSRFFYWLGKYSWQLRALRTPAEVFNKRGKTLHVYIGDPIPAAEIQKLIDSKDLACLLYQKTYGVKETV